jgi:hypothetical protein
MLGDPRPVVQRLTEELAVSEDMAEPGLQDAELVGVGGRDTIVQAIARSWT